MGKYINVNPDHEWWIKDNEEYLKNNGIEFEDYRLVKEQNLTELYPPLINKRWIRATLASNNLPWSDKGYINFDIYDFDTKTLKIIEEKLFNFLGATSDISIGINKYHGGIFYKFYWDDFIKSGENFIDFIRGQI